MRNEEEVAYLELGREQMLDLGQLRYKSVLECCTQMCTSHLSPSAGHHLAQARCHTARAPARVRPASTAHCLLLSTVCRTPCAASQGLQSTATLDCCIQAHSTSFANLYGLQCILHFGHVPRQKGPLILVRQGFPQVLDSTQRQRPPAREPR